MSNDVARLQLKRKGVRNTWRTYTYVCMSSMCEKLSRKKHLLKQTARGSRMRTSVRPYRKRAKPETNIGQ